MLGESKTIEVPQRATTPPPSSEIKQESVIKEESKLQYLPKPYIKKRYYTPYDVSLHMQANDCWVSIFNEVIDITSILQDNIKSNRVSKCQQISIDPLCEPLILNAGKDISYWFDKETGDPRKHYDTAQGKQVYYWPQGEFLGISEKGPLIRFALL